MSGDPAPRRRSGAIRSANAGDAQTEQTVASPFGNGEPVTLEARGFQLDLFCHPRAIGKSVLQQTTGDDDA